MPNDAQELAFAKELFKRLEIEPSQLEKSERPDFIFEHNSVQHGLEVTRCTPEEYIRGTKLAQVQYEKTGKLRLHSFDQLLHRQVRRSNKELKKDLFQGCCAPFQKVEDSLTNWTKGVWKTIQGKRTILNSTNPSPFQKFEQNWLLIWDDVGIDNDQITKQILFAIMEKQSWHTHNFDKDFDVIYIISCDFLFRLSPEGIVHWHFNK